MESLISLLTDDCLVAIFRFCDVTDIPNLAIQCRRFASLTDRSDLWRHFFCRQVPWTQPQADPLKTWRQRFEEEFMHPCVIPVPVANPEFLEDIAWVEDWSGLVVRGGFATALAMKEYSKGAEGNNPPYKDINFCALGRDDGDDGEDEIIAQAAVKLARVWNKMYDYWGEDVNINELTFTGVKEGTHPTKMLYSSLRGFNLLLRRMFTDVAQVIQTTDLDCCRFVYNGKWLLTDRIGYRCLHTNRCCLANATAIGKQVGLDANHLTTVQTLSEHRVGKYQRRYPQLRMVRLAHARDGFDICLVSPYLLENIDAEDYEDQAERLKYVIQRVRAWRSQLDTRSD